MSSITYLDNVRIRPPKGTQKIVRGMKESRVRVLTSSSPAESLLVCLKVKLLFKTSNNWDFPAGPVVKDSLCNAGDSGSTPAWGIKILHATEQLS